jgi:heat shock protein HslJ
MFSMMLTVPLLILTHLFLAQGTPTPPDYGIPPGVWELVSYTETEAEPVEIVDPTRYTLQFQPDGQVLAQFDCNRGSGQYTATDGVLTVSSVVTTLILCPSDSQVEPFQILLSVATSYEIDAEGYLILRGDAGDLRIRPALA